MTIVTTRPTGHLPQGAAVRPVSGPTVKSSLVQRLVLAKDDPAKRRIRAWLGDIDDERLFRLGLTSEDIAALRGGVSRRRTEATAAHGLDRIYDASSRNHQRISNCKVRS